MESFPFPSEIFTMILDMLKVKDLSNCTLVQKRWNSVAKQVLLTQARKIDTVIKPEIRQELSTHALEPVGQMMTSVDLILSIKEMKSLYILQLYQNTFCDLGKTVTIQVKHIAGNVLSVKSEPEPGTSANAAASTISSSPLEQSFFSCLIPSTRKRFLSSGFGPQGLLDNKLVFISCHNIMVVPYLDNYKAKFYVMAKQLKVEANMEYIDTEPDKEWRWEEYGVRFKNIFSVSWDRMSVYGDTILVLKPRNRFDLLKITGVEHKIKKVNLTRQEEVVVEVGIKDFVNFNGRIFVLPLRDLTFILVRDNEAKRQKRIEILVHPSLLPCFNRQFYRVNNLIFIAVKHNYPILFLQKYESRPWLLFDGCLPDPVVHTVNINLLVRVLLQCSNMPYCQFVDSIFTFNNLLIVLYCYYSETDFKDQSQLNEIDQKRRILVATMKRPPCVEDFSSCAAFASLFTSPSATSEFVGQMSAPFYYQGFYKSVSVIGGQGDVNFLHHFNPRT